MSHDFQILPADEYNETLIGHVHPSDWINPTPAGRYNLVVIGGGPAGLVAAAGAAGCGARVALVERQLMGGDCLNFGCVPSKALINAARRAAGMRGHETSGLSATGVQIDFAAAMQRLRRLRSEIGAHDSVRRFTSLGVDVFLGSGHFTSPDTLKVNETELLFHSAVIATGARAATPPIPGLASVNALTNETVFSLTELPARLAIIGGGPIGCEMAQSFARLGSQVSLIESSPGILPREDPEAAAIVQARLQQDGVNLLSSAQGLQLAPGANGTILVTLDSMGVKHDLTVDHLLLAAGRAPNIEGLNLEAAGVRYDRTGVLVDDMLRTTNRRVFAAGDICSRYQFTHSADFMARTVIQNALFFGRKKMSQLIIPWATYTSPEIAHVGLTAAQAQARGLKITTYTQSLSAVDRALLDGETDGMVRVHVRQGTDQIVGATIVAEHAGDMISEITLAMTHKIGLDGIAATIHPYPTQAEAIRKIGDQYNRTRLTPRLRSLFSTLMSWRRR